MAIPPKVYEVLLALVEQQGQPLSKDALLERVWPDTVVEESNLTVSISALRKVLGERRDEHQFIATIPGVGYQFVAAVRQPNATPPSLIVERQTVSQVIIEEETSERMATSEPPLLLPPPAALALPASLPAATRHFTISRRQTLAVGGLAVLLLSLAAVIFFRRQPPQSAGQVRSLAVLPFSPLNPGARDESLGLGLADALITQLSNTGVIAVRPTSAIQQYTAAGRDPLAIGRQLGVEAVLDGRVQRSGDQLRLTVQLLRAGDGTPLWAESFDEQFTNVFAVQKTVSAKIARALTLQLTAEQEQRLKKDYTANAEAFQAYLQGRYWWNRRNEGGLKKGIEFFQQALEKDPHYALAYVGLADSYLLLEEYFGTPASETYPKAKAYAEAALRIDDTLAEAHTSLAGTDQRLWQWREAEREYRRAISLNPNYPTAHQWYGSYLVAQGRLDEAIAEYQRAQEADPLSPIIGANNAKTWLRKGDLSAAIEQANKAIALAPNFPEAHRMLGMTWLRQRRDEAALAELQQAAELSGRVSLYLSSLGYGYALAGKRREARAILKEMEERHARREALGLDVAAVYAGFGDPDQAFAWLEKDFQARSGALMFIVQEPRFDALRSDPRYAGLLRRMGLEP